LIQSLNLKHYRIFISGTKKERELLQPLFDEVGERVTDTTGRMDLYQFISFIAACDGLIANSTGPLHIASALGRDAFGIYPPVRPMHPGRWAPLGINSKVFVLNKFCNDCKGSTKICHCIKEVPQSSIKAEINKIAFEKMGDIING
jgi:ADP-heptose:LPS heptosyltransferase